MFDSTGDETVIFPLRPRASPVVWEPETGALDVWRRAEVLVVARWDAFLAAEPDSRLDAYAAYAAALDAEEAAAADLALLGLQEAA